MGYPVDGIIAFMAVVIVAIAADHFLSLKRIGRRDKIENGENRLMLDHGYQQLDDGSWQTPTGEILTRFNAITAFNVAHGPISMETATAYGIPL